MSSSFPIGVMFPKAQEHFIPFHASRELSKTMEEILNIKKEILKMPGKLGAQIAHAGSREEERDPGFRRLTFWRHSIGAADYPGRLWIYLTVSGFHLGFMCTLLWELGKGTITPQGAVAELLVHWSRQSCSR